MKEKVKPYEGIHVMHMIKCIINKWYVIAISMVIFGCLFGTYSYYKDKISMVNATKDEINNMSISYQSEEEILENSGLSLKAQQEVEFYTNKIFHYTEQYDKQKEYIDNSILMQLDPNEIWTMTLYYDFMESTISEGKEAAYLAKILNVLTYEEIAKVLNIDKDSKYLAELIDCNSIGAWRDLEQEEYKNIDSGSDLKIEVKYSSKEGCESIVNILKSIIEKENQEQIKLNPNQQLALTGEQIVLAPDVVLMKNQEIEIKALNNIANEIMNATNNIESTEKVTSEKLLEYYEDEKFNVTKLLYDKEPVLRVTQTEDTMEQFSIRKPSVSKKYIAFGLIFGFLFQSGLLALLYFCSGRLQMPQEIEEGYNVESIATDCVVVAATIIAEKCKKSKYRKVYLTSTVEEKRNELMEFSKAVNAQLEETEKIDFVIDQNGILSDEQEPQYLVKTDAVLIIEVCKISRHKNIANVLQLSNALNKPVCGIVVV